MNTILNKVRVLSLLVFVLTTFFWYRADAQCTNCASDGLLNTISYSSPTFAPSWTTVQTNTVKGRQYMLFNVAKGQIYKWSTVGSEDYVSGIGQVCAEDSHCPAGLKCIGLVGEKTCDLGFDTELTVLRGTCSSSGEVLAYNRNASYKNQSEVEWKSDFDGTVFVLVTNYQCSTSCDQFGGNCMTTSVKWQRIDSTYCSDCQRQTGRRTFVEQTPKSSIKKGLFTYGPITGDEYEGYLYRGPVKAYVSSGAAFSAGPATYGPTTGAEYSGYITSKDTTYINLIQYSTTELAAGHKIVQGANSTTVSSLDSATQLYLSSFYYPIPINSGDKIKQGGTVRTITSIVNTGVYSPTSSTWTTVADNIQKAGDFLNFEVQKGRIYRWTTCGDNTFDTQLTLFRKKSDADPCGEFLAYSDDTTDSPCSTTNSKQSILEWRSDFDGQVSLLVNEYNCRFCYQSPDENNPWTHCPWTTVKMQRYDCYSCGTQNGSTRNFTDNVETVSGLVPGNYMKFNAVKGVKYRFKSTQPEGSSSFSAILTLRKENTTACAGETLGQSKLEKGSTYVQVLDFSVPAEHPSSTMVVELLVSRSDVACSATAYGKTATVTYEKLSDPASDYEDNFFDESDGTTCCNWTGVTRTKEGMVVYDQNVYKETWAEAMDYCENLSYTIPGSSGSGGDKVEDWVLPNISELYSLVDFDLYDKATGFSLPSYVSNTAGEGAACTLYNQETTCGYPQYICGDELKCVRNNWYWTSTSVADSTFFGWGINMKDGRSYRVLKEDHIASSIPATKHKVICIRGDSMSGEFDPLRPARERKFSGWACDKNKPNNAVNIYFVIRDKNGNIIPKYEKFKIQKCEGDAEPLPNVSSVCAFKYGATDLFPAVGSLKETKINANCSGTAQSTEHAFEVNLDATDGIAKSIKDTIAAQGSQPIYTVTAYGSNAETVSFKIKVGVLLPQKEPFVLTDVCGDNLISVSEGCDDGNSVTENCAYNTTCNVCNSSCQWAPGYSPHCGDLTLDAPDETCDCGPGFWLYDCSQSLPSKRCPGYGSGTCQICNEICNAEILDVPYCGDGTKDSVEACDDGDASNNNACKTDCTFNTCGDSYIFNSGPGANETCDDGTKNGYYENQCTPGPCCNTTCNGAGPRCGDSILQKEVCGAIPGCVNAVGASEACDKGADNGKWLTLDEHNVDPGCNSTCSGLAPYCGDGTTQAPYEICDDGASNQDGVYGKCRTDCSAKPRCGDGKLDGPGGDGLVTGPEFCDDGANNGAYGFCNTTCTGIVHCGDAILQSSHEECDTGTGNFQDYAIQKQFSCRTDCTVGRYCGDAFLDNSRGVPLNNWKDPAAWSSATGIVWDTTEEALKITGYRNVYLKVAIPIDTTKQYYLEYDIMTKNNDGTGLYAGTMSYDSSMVLLAGHPGTYDYFGDANANFTADQWYHRRNSYIGGQPRTGESATVGQVNRWHPGTAFARVLLLVNYSTPTTQETYIKNLKFYTIEDGVTGLGDGELCDHGDVDHGAGNLPVGNTVSSYMTACSEICKWFHYCGDGLVDGAGGTGYTGGPEVCDDGALGNINQYNKCAPGCLKFGPRCGDGIKNGPELCDKHPSNTTAPGIAYNSTYPNDYIATCRPGCTWAKCGDGIIDDMWGVTYPEDKLLYHFNEGSGTTVNDSSGTITAKSITGSVNWVDGRYGKALNFDGTTFIDVGNPASLQLTGDMTIEMWLYPSNFNEQRIVFYKNDLYEGGLKINTNGTLTFGYGNGSTSQTITSPLVNALRLNSWNHVVAVRDFTEGKLKFFINGVKTNQVNTIFASAAVGTDSVFVGGTSDTDGFQGIIDEVRVISRALTDVEATAISREECDDGALNSNTIANACRTTCVRSKCGDGIRDSGEQCDDMNDIPNDSCNNCKNSRCGDGVVKTTDSTLGDFTWSINEICDDGNKNNNDYCRFDCLEVNGYCGDGTIQSGHPASESCDNASFGEGIGAYCTGDCTGSGASMTCAAGCKINHGSCGDGNIDYVAGEACDDGNSTNGDYCSYPSCQVTGYCGDAILQINEVCDSSTTAPGIGAYCIDSCQTNLGSCGDGKIQGPGYTTAYYGGTLPVTSGWTIQGPEYCDTNDPRTISLTNTTGCNSTCTRDGTCGDGIRQSRFEACDVLLDKEVIYLKLNESSGTVAADSSGNGRTGTVSGAVWTNPGISGNALNFDGVNDYVSASVPTYPKMTIAAWANIDPTETDGEIAGNTHTNSAYAYGFSLYVVGNMLRAKAATNNNSYFYNNVAYDISALKGKWAHYAMTWENTGGCNATVKLYVNGTKVSEGSTTLASTPDDCTKPYPYPFSVGGCYSTSFTRMFKGLVDDVKVYSKALDAHEIRYVMNSKILCQTGCKGDPRGVVDQINNTLIHGWSCDPDKPLTQTTTRLEFYDKNNTFINARNVVSSIAADQTIKNICGGGSNQRWSFDPNDATLNLESYATNQPFRVDIYAVTTDGAPETDTLIGTGQFTMKQICGDGVIQRADCTGYSNCEEVDPADIGSIETCDDGNTVNIDNCKNDCTIPYCGDSVISTSATGTLTEVCDANTTSCASTGIPALAGSTGTATCQSDCKSWVTASKCTKTNTCPAKPQTNLETKYNAVPSYSQTWNGSAWVPTDDLVTEYNEKESYQSCRFRCLNSYFSYNSGLNKCEGITRNYDCVVETGNPLPVGAQWNTVSSYSQTYTFNGTSWVWIPASDASIDYNETASTESCRYICTTDYHQRPPSTGICDYNYLTHTCTNLPSHSTWNTVGSYTRTWNPGTLTYDPPATTAAYNEVASSNECRFVCDTGYYYNPFESDPNLKCFAGHCGDGTPNVLANDLLPGTAPLGIPSSASHDTPTGEVTLTLAMASDYGIYNYNGKDLGKSFVISFDFWTGGGTAIGGDALYFYAYNTSAPTNEDAAAGGYIFAFDEYDDQLQIKWNGANVASAAQSYLDNSKWNRGTVMINQLPDGRTELRMFVNKRKVVDTIDSTVRAKTGTYFGFGARTGGATNVHKIKNITISKEVCDDGINNGSYNGCASDCKSYGSVCGDLVNNGDTWGIADASEVLRLRFEENYSDTSGKGNNATNSGGAIYANGRYGQTYLANGTSSYLSIPDSTSMRVSSYTVEAWINPYAIPDWVGIVGKPGRNYSMWLNPNGFIHHRFHDSASTNSGCPDTPVGSIPLNKWSHVVITNNGTTCKTYINGVEKASGSVTGSLVVDPGITYVGKSPDGGASAYFNGLIDEVRIYNRALSLDEILRVSREKCDGGLGMPDPSTYTTTASCALECSYNRYCGDGTKDAEEVCDFRRYYGVDELCDAAFGARSYYSTSTPVCNLTCTGVGASTVCHYCGDGIENGTETESTKCEYNKSYTADEMCDRRLGARDYYPGSVASCNTSCNNTATCYYCGDGIMTASDYMMFLKMDENSGNYAWDTSVNNNHGYVTTGYSWTTGPTNNAYAMNFWSSNMYVPHSATMTLGPAMSIEFWIKTSQTVSADPPIPIIHKGVHAGVINYAAWLEPAKNGLPTGHISFVFYNSAASGCGIHSTTAINNGAWNHIVATLGDSYMKIYVNGVYQAQEYCGITPTASSEPLRIGWNNIAGYPLFSGQLDELRLYNRTLAHQEVMSNMYEKCDAGANNGVYNSGCSTDCQIGGARCGDGVVQSANGETCDAGAGNYDTGEPHPWDGGSMSGWDTGPGPLGTGSSTYRRTTCNTECSKYAPHGSLDTFSLTQMGGWACDYDKPSNQTYAYVSIYGADWIPVTHYYFYFNQASEAAVGAACEDTSGTGHRVNHNPSLQQGYKWNGSDWQWSPTEQVLTTLKAQKARRPFRFLVRMLDYPSYWSYDRHLNNWTDFGGSCGDGVVQSDFEVCDSAHCRTNCSAMGFCGDGVVDMGEVCDGAGCLADCSGWA